MNFPSKLALAVSCALLTGQAFCGDTKEKAGAGLAIETAADQFPLGTAYRSAGGDYLGLQTVKGTQVDYLGNSNMDFRVGVDLGYEQALKLIDGKVDAGFKLPAVRVDAGANYAKEIAADKYTGTYTVYSSLKPKSRMLLPEAGGSYQPTSAAMELVDLYPGDRANNLGDGFVHGYAYGSNVVINMKIDYRNESDKRTIGGYLSVDWLGQVEVKGQLQNMDDEKKQSVKISISGYQSGGDPNRLLDIIPNGIMRCTLLNPTPCFELFSAAVNYLKNDYIYQFDDLSDYNITETYIAPYSRSGPGVHVLMPVEGYTKASYLTKLVVRDLTQRWTEEKLVYRRAKNLQRYYASNFEPDRIAQLREIEIASRNNANLFADMVDFCELNPEGNFCADYERDNMGFYQDYSAIQSALD